MRTNRSSRLPRLPALLLALAGLTALPAPGQAAPAPGQRPSPAATARPPAVTAAPVPDKPTAPIGIAYTFAGEPAVGNALEITLTVSAGAPLRDIVVTLGADDPLPILEPVMPVGLGALAAVESKDVSVTVLPLVARTHRLRVSVSALIGGRPQTRALVVPIRLAPPGPAKPAAPAGNAAGKNENAVRSFRAVETVR